MQLFGPQSETRYDLRFSLFGIPVRVHPFFWVAALLFGAASANFIALLIWVVLVFVTILIHELGHALTMRSYGQPCRIFLYLGGGLTVPQPVLWGGSWMNVSLTPAQEILIALAGPGADFVLTALIIAGSLAAGGKLTLLPLFGVIPFPAILLPAGGWVVNYIVSTLIWINIFWGIINLMPVHPLDGGNVARYALLKLDPVHGVKTSLQISMVAGIVVALAGLILFQSIYIALLFGLLAFQSYQNLKGRTGSWY